MIRTSALVTRPRASLVVMASVALAASLVSGVSAQLNAQERNANASFTTAALYAPSNLSAAYAGRTATLTWTTGTNGNGYSVLGAANGASSDCAGATFSALASTSALTFTDTGRYAPQGNWYCYRVQTTYSSWTSVIANPTVAVQLGFVAASVSLSNGANAGKLDTGDQIVATFDQPVDTTTGPAASDGICSTGTNVLLLGTSTDVTSCSSTEAKTVGSLSGGTSETNARWAATWTWSNGNRTLTATIGSRVSGSGNTFASGTWVYNPVTTSTKILSATGAFHVCDTNAGGGLCLPTATDSF